MSIYDDAQNGSGTQVYCEYWYSAEPNAWTWVASHFMQEKGAPFLECAGCLAYVDATNVVVGDFGDLHCEFCGSDEIYLGDDDE